MIFFPPSVFCLFSGYPLLHCILPVPVVFQYAKPLTPYNVHNKSALLKILLRKCETAVRQGSKERLCLTLKPLCYLCWDLRNNLILLLYINSSRCLHNRRWGAQIPKLCNRSEFATPSLGLTVPPAKIRKWTNSVRDSSNTMEVASWLPLPQF